jgi:leader peptidase (prepilin peptidase) / N-methyltransferase
MTLHLLFFVTALLAGLAVGSFLNVVADRVPQGRSVIWPPSHCGACGRRLAAAELIPIVSYLALRGRCRTCGASIGRRVLFVEVMGAAIAVLAWRGFGLTVVAVLAAIYGWLFLVLSVMDIEHQKVPRLLLAGGIAVAVVTAPWGPAAGLIWALLGGLIAGLPYLLLYIVAGWIYGHGKGVGIGDVWAAVLMGVVVGYPAVIVALLAAAVTALAVAIALLLTGRRGRRDVLPTIPFFAVGVLTGVLWSAGYLTLLLRP